MDKQIQKLGKPYYKKIYTDILNKKFPDKKEECKSLLEKEILSVLDIIKLNQKIFGSSNKSAENFNQKHRSYQNADILKVLDYQTKNKLNNTQVANYFKISRNTIAKWKNSYKHNLID